MRWRYLVAMLLCCLPLANLVKASIIVKLSDQQMAVRADRIVRAQVVDRYTRFDKKTRRVYTYVKLSVLEPIKGAKSSQEIVVRQVGGTANGVGMHVPGAAKFKHGEEVVVFLEKIAKTGFHHVMGMSYGKLEVRIDTKTKLRVLSRTLKGIALAQPNSKGKMTLEHAKPSAKPIVLRDFVNRLKGYLRVVKPSLPPLQRKGATLKTIPGKTTPTKQVVKGAVPSLSKPLPSTTPKTPLKKAK